MLWSPGQVGLQTQGFGVLGHGLVHLALRRQGLPQVVMGPGQTGLQTQGLGILGQQLRVDLGEALLGPSFFDLGAA